MPTKKQIDAILPFLALFTVDGFSTGVLHGPPGEFPWFAYSKPVLQFQQALYDHGWVTPSFNWPKWQETAKEYVKSPERIDAADIKTIRKLLTTHVRKERFREGHLAEMFESGHVVALLRRLQELRITMSQRIQKDSDLAIESLRNIGPKSAKWLREAGVHTIADLERQGPVAVYRLVKQCQPKASLKLLWAMTAGLKGKDRRKLSEAMKKRLRKEVE